MGFDFGYTGVVNWQKERVRLIVVEIQFFLCAYVRRDFSAFSYVDSIFIRSPSVVIEDNLTIFGPEYRFRVTIVRCECDCKCKSFRSIEYVIRRKSIIIYSREDIYIFFGKQNICFLSGKYEDDCR